MWCKEKGSLSAVEKTDCIFFSSWTKSINQCVPGVFILTSFHFAKWSVCYIAKFIFVYVFNVSIAEYMQSGRATEKADVYSFGVLVLEVLSGKRPTDASFIEKGLNIVGWVRFLSSPIKYIASAHFFYFLWDHSQ